MIMGRPCQWHMMMPVPHWQCQEPASEGSESQKHTVPLALAECALALPLPVVRASGPRAPLGSARSYGQWTTQAGPVGPKWERSASEQTVLTRAAGPGAMIIMRRMAIGL